eukprot:scaffold27991_cov54-Phaeocystis_antarctica.AAC.3
MSVTLDVSKLSGWLNAAACCRIETRACDAGRDASAGGGSRWKPAAHHKHAAHVRDSGSVPVGYVRVKVSQVIEELTHVGDA